MTYNKFDQIDAFDPHPVIEKDMKKKKRSDAELIRTAKDWWNSISLAEKRHHCIHCFNSTDFLMLSDINIYTIYSRQ